MNTPDRFLRFAAECEAMAKFSRSPENRQSATRLGARQRPQPDVEIGGGCRKMQLADTFACLPPVDRTPSGGHRT